MVFTDQRGKNQVLGRREMHGRWWTQAGAKAAAAYALAELPTDGMVGVRMEVGRMDPVINVYADRYWHGDQYIGPEV